MARKIRFQSQVKSYQRNKKMVLDSGFLNTPDYEVCIKGEVEQPRLWSSSLLNTSVQ